MARKSKRERLKTSPLPEDLVTALGAQSDEPDYCMATIKSKSGPALHIAEADLNDSSNLPRLHIGIIDTGVDLESLINTMATIQKAAQRSPGEIQHQDVAVRDGVALRISEVFDGGKKRSKTIFSLFRPEGREKEQIISDGLPPNVLSRFQKVANDWVSSINDAREDASVWSFDGMQDAEV